jgi:hypothetical protein
MYSDNISNKTCFLGIDGGHEDHQGGLRARQDPSERGCQAGAADSGENVRKSTLPSGECSRRNEAKRRSFHEARRGDGRSERSGQNNLFVHYLLFNVCLGFLIDGIRTTEFT